MRLHTWYKLYDFLKNFKKKATVSALAVIYDITHTDVLLSASSLVYFTIISIIPFLVFIVPLLKAYGAFEGVNEVISSFLMDMLGAQTADKFKEAITGYIDNGISLGIMGVFVFGYSSVALVNKIKKNVNKVYKLPKAKEGVENIFSSFGKSFVYILVFSFLLVLISLMYSYVYGMTGKNLNGFLSSAVVKRIALDLFVVLLFFLLFTSMPDVYVNPKYSIIGALFFLVGFRVINLVIIIMTKYFFKTKTHVYGTAAYIISGMLWIYMFWAILIIAVEVSYVLQYRPNVVDENKKTQAQSTQNSIEVMNMIIKGFENGNGGARLSEISSSLSISNQEVIEICDKFEKENLISSIGKLKKRLYAPYCPVENLKLYYILHTIDGDWDHKKDSSKIMEELDELKISNFQNKKISDYQ